MYVKYSALLLIIFTSSAYAQDSSQEVVQFQSTPQDVSVTIIDRKDKEYVRSCITPCSLTLDMSRSLKFLGEKDGYKNSKKSGAFATDSLNRELAIFRSPGFENSKRSMRITLKPKKSGPSTSKDYNAKNTKGFDGSIRNICSQYVDGDKVKTPNPIKTAYPTLPADAKSSGHCEIKFNIDYQGHVQHPEATFCSSKIFKNDAIETVKAFRYSEGDPAQGRYQYCGAKTSIVYKVSR